jgi:ribonuclease BN (tRNA processing enzyme)
MQIRVLGCSGGIGGDRHTTTLLLDDDILIDAGSGVSRLSLEELARVDHVFITHSHLDHVHSLPLLLDSVAGERQRPVTVHGLPEVLQILKDHIFNWRIWPDFARIPTPEAPMLVFQPLALGHTVMLGERAITAIPAHHVVPACGYLLRGEDGALLFSGDTASHEALWNVARTTPDLRHLIVETSFPNALAELAQASLHYCPQTLADDLLDFGLDVPVWITHLKPGSEPRIMDEIHAALPGRRVEALIEEQVFRL